MPPSKNKKEKHEHVSHQTRDPVLNQIYQLLNDEDKARQIEKSILKSSKQYCDSQKFTGMLTYIYEQKADNIIQNINPESKLENTELKDKILNDEVELKEIANLSPLELCHEKWKKIKHRKKYNINKATNLATIKTFKCPKCGARKHTVRVEQRRRGDEAPTVIYTCQKCGKRVNINR
jgi:DNA-directed RNA polymerase subunit M/transcription elongation factor TFIIS